MRVAALYDIHGNLPALEAVVQDIRQADVDQIVVGAMLFPAPCPAKRLGVCWTWTCLHTSFTAMANWPCWRKWPGRGPGRSPTGAPPQARVPRKYRRNLSLDYRTASARIRAGARALA